MDTAHPRRAVHEPAAERNRRRAELQGDRRLVAAYGAEHPDAFAGVTTELVGESSRLVVGFTGDLDLHSARLRELASHADRLDVIETPASRSQLERIRSAIVEELSSGPDEPRLSGPGVVAFRVQVHLAAYAEDAARRLVARYGDAVEVRVGALRYPVDVGEGRPAPFSSQEPLLDDTVEISGVRPWVVRSDHDLDSELLLTNHGPSSLVIENWGKAIGHVLDPATGEVVGGFVGNHPTVLVRFTASPLHRANRSPCRSSWARRPTGDRSATPCLPVSGQSRWCSISGRTVGGAHRYCRCTSPLEWVGDALTFVG